MEATVETGGFASSPITRESLFFGAHEDNDLDTSKNQDVGRPLTTAVASPLPSGASLVSFLSSSQTTTGGAFFSTNVAFNANVLGFLSSIISTPT